MYESRLAVALNNDIERVCAFTVILTPGPSDHLVDVLGISNFELL
jgi:hypothetical protein